MKPASFVYHAPSTVAEACALLAEYGDDAKPLAGGQSLVPMLALRLTRFGHLVDLNRVAELAGVAHQDGHLVVRAATRQRVMERDPTVADAVPALARATPLIGHFQIRNRGTVGGSLAHADPASEYPAVALALDADFELARAGGASRRVGAAEFFTGTWTTCAEPDELLVEARFPIWEGRCGFAVQEVARRHGDFALAGVVCGVACDPAGAVTRSVIALFGVAPTPLRCADAEAALRSGASIRDVAETAVRDLRPPDDVHASGSTRRRLARVLIERAAITALEEARG